MFHQTLPGFIEVICGSMFSGKTEELLRRIKRAQIARQKVQVFKPAMDNRYSSEHVQSHDSNKIASLCVDRPRDILRLVDDNTRVVGIDEAQFFDENIVDVAQKLAYRGMRVIVAGLDLDFRGIPFGPMPKLLAVAEEVTKLSAVCVVCGKPASRTQKIAGDRGVNASRIAVGAKDMYEARCRFCHEPGIASSTTADERTGPNEKGTSVS
ncbi:MAG: thymidine kinase [Bdellovibrionota bacterium]